MKTENRERARRPLVIPSIALTLGILTEERLCQHNFICEHPILGLIPIIGCFYFAYMGKVEKNRKIILYFLLIGMTSAFISIFSLEWGVSIKGDTAESLTGRIVRIEKLEDRTEMVLDSIDEIPLNGKVLVRLNAERSDLVSFNDLGKRIRIVLELERPKAAGNPGGFDYRKYLYGRGIALVGTFKGIGIEPVDNVVGVRFRFISWIIMAREGFLHSFFSDNDARELAGGILFGMGRNISEEVRTEYMEGGAGHILAVSGLHIGILYALCKEIEKKSKVRSNVAKKALVVGFFLVYGTASLWSVSVTRAILLVIAKEVSDIMDYRFDTLNVLALISDAMLVCRPYLVFSNGFQMSFLAILGICFLQPKMACIIRKILDRFLENGVERKEFESAISTMLAVQLLMIPYTAYFYNRFSALAIINNWFMITLAGVYVPIGAGSFFLSIIADMLPGVDLVKNYLGSALSHLGRIMTEINGVFLLEGKSVISVSSPHIYFLAAMMLVILYLASESFKVEQSRNRIAARVKAIRIGLLTAVTSFVLFFNPILLADQVFVDVGQGDALHLRWKGVNILVDGGGNTNYNVGDSTLRPYLLHRGIQKLDMAISTHQHTDHFKGIEELNEIYSISQIVTYGKAGDRIVFDDNHYIDVLWPIPGREESEDENYFSRIFKIYNRGIITLVTGDITEDGERALIAHYGEDSLKAHILKVSHHGSRFSTCQEFIDAVSPVIAIISVGKNNYGHPAVSTIEKLEGSGIIVYRTDVDGAIGIIIGENKFWVCGNRRNMRIEKYNLN